MVMEPEAGIGPATYALRVRCSTTELPGRDALLYRPFQLCLADERRDIARDFTKRRTFK